MKERFSPTYVEIEPTGLAGLSGLAYIEYDLSKRDPSAKGAQYWAGREEHLREEDLEDHLLDSFEELCLALHISPDLHQVLSHYIRGLPEGAEKARFARVLSLTDKDAP